MRLYARSPVLRGRQLLADTGLAVWVVVWVLVARAVHDARMQDAGGMRATLRLSQPQPESEFRCD